MPDSARAPGRGRRWFPGRWAAPGKAHVIVAAALLAAAIGAPTAALAQSIEPRLYANAPTGLNFALVGYARSTGGVVLDASIPLEDASISIDSMSAGYARSLALAGRSAQIQLVVPYAWLSGEGVFTTTGERRTRDVNGFGDPAVRFACNLHGAPALSPAEFGGYHQDLIVGASLQVTAPLGQYDPDKMVNLGTNRWSFKPEVGISKALGRFIVEASAAASLYTENDDFFGGHQRSQDPIYSAQAHLIYSFKHGIWGALDGTYYTGGRTTLDGVDGNDLQKNWRTGLTVSAPINRWNSIKIYLSNGVSTRSGDDFTLAGAAWQHRWGAGF